MTEHTSNVPPEDTGAEAAKDQPRPRQENPPAEGGQGTADNARSALRFVELKKHLVQMNEENIEVPPEEYAELAELFGQLQNNKHHSFLEQEAIRELMPKGERLTNVQIAGALGVDTRTLRKWRHADWYKNSIERYRREWRRKMEIFPVFHPVGIGFELQAVLNKPGLSDADRLKAIQMAATILPGLVPAEMRQEEEDAPGALTNTITNLIQRIGGETLDALIAKRRQAAEQAEEKDREAPPDQP